MIAACAHPRSAQPGFRGYRQTFYNVAEGSDESKSQGAWAPFAKDAVGTGP